MRTALAEKNYIEISPLRTLAIILSASLGFLTANPLLTVACLLTPPIFAVLVWRKGEPPILFMTLMFQWLEVSTRVLYSDFIGIPAALIDEVPKVTTAVPLALLGLVVLAAGMRGGLRGLRQAQMAQARAEVMQYSIDRVAFLYFTVFFASLLLKGFIWAYPGLTQILLAFFNVKWAFFFLLALVVLLRREKTHYLVIAFMAEVVVGMISFFSEFKQPFLILIVVLMSLGRRFKRKNIGKAVVLSAALLFLCVVWSSIKKEYREFINEGTGQQVATVPVGARLQKMLELYSSIDSKSLQEGVTNLLERVSYIEFFSYTLGNVPQIIPHENGALLNAAFQHVLMPRFVFPDKPVVNQTALTSKYTGLEFSEYVSVSLGYMAEFYVDFGPVGMFVPVAVLGYLFGAVYRFFPSHGRSKIFGFLMTVVVMASAASFGINLVILVGGVTVGFVAAFLFLEFLSPPLARWLSVEGT